MQRVELSPWLDKAEAPGDDELLNEDSRAGSRSAVLTLLDMSNEREDITSTLNRGFRV